jgi:uncharacterized protein
MLLVKTKLGISSIPGAGLGCFAAQFIQHGQPMWCLNTKFDMVLIKEEIYNLSDACRAETIKHVYYDIKIDRYILCSDSARFYNHSDTPNTGPLYDGFDGDTDYALRDIHVGEEILCDYRTWYPEGNIFRNEL